MNEPSGSSELGRALLPGPSWRIEVRNLDGLERTGHCSADAAACTAIAAQFDLVRCARVELDYRLRPIAGGGYRLDGRLSADVVQASVVSLENVEQQLHEDISVVFLPPAQLAEFDDDADEFDRPDPEPIEDGVIDLARVTYEVLSVALDAYPRGPGEALDVQTTGGGEDSPFAILKRLRDLS